MNYTGEGAVDFLVKLLNAGFDEGLLPDNWTKSLFPPLFKKSNVNDPNNYIGIFFFLSFFCDIKSKLYSSNKLGVWSMDMFKFIWI